jgi:hypothetical protein
MSEIVPFSWREEEHASRYGEGVSRPKAGNRTRQFRLMVFRQGAQPMVWITRAESQRHALRYAEARWPGAVVEVA